MALALSEKGKRLAPPNPWVGAILVNVAGEVLGQGFHTGPGNAHAEVEASAGKEESKRKSLHLCRTKLTPKDRKVKKQNMLL